MMTNQHYDATKDVILLNYLHFFNQPIQNVLEAFLQEKIPSYQFAVRLSAKLIEDKSILENTIKQLEEKYTAREELTISEFVLIADYYRFFSTNYIKALLYYNQAAEKGSVDALNNLGWMYAGACGVNQDFTKAKTYFEKAAAQNHAGALNNLGVLHHHGLGHERSPQEAMRYYQLAAEQLHASALYNLGNIHYEGLGLPFPDYEKAKEYFEQAAQQGSTDALFNLAVMYHQGHGVERSYAHAAKYYYHVYKMGDHSVRQHLEVLFNEQSNHAHVIYHAAMAVNDPVIHKAFNTLANDHPDLFDNLLKQDDWDHIKVFLDPALVDLVMQRNQLVRH